MKGRKEERKKERKKERQTNRKKEKKKRKKDKLRLCHDVILRSTRHFRSNRFTLCSRRTQVQAGLGWRGRGAAMQINCKSF